MSEENTNGDVDISMLDIEGLAISEPEEVVPDRSGGALKIAVIGSGQAGGRIAKAFHALGYAKAIYINTTEQDVTDIPYKAIMSIPGVVGGAGKDMNVAKEAFNASSSKVYNLIDKVCGEVDHIFVAAGLGGGTGCGSVVPLVELCKKYMRYIGHNNAENRVGVIATIPGNGELTSPIIRENTLTTATQLSEMADNNQISPLVLIDNEKVKKLYKNITMDKFYPTINSSIAQFIDSFNLIAKQPSNLTTFDSKDFQSIMQSNGHMLVSVTAVQNYDDKEEFSNAVATSLKNNIIVDSFDFATAKTAGVVVLANKDILSSVPNLEDNISYSIDTLASICNSATIHRGVYSQKNPGVRVFTMLSGMTIPKERYNKIEKYVM